VTLVLELHAPDLRGATGGRLALEMTPAQTDALIAKLQEARLHGEGAL